MRYVLVAILGFALVATGMFLPWGDKHVTRGECQNILTSDGQPGLSCNMSSVDALYWSDHLTATLRFWETVDGERVSDVSRAVELHDYQTTGSELDGNAGLFWGRPVLWFSMGLGGFALLMVGATRNRQDGARWAAVGLWLGTGGLLAMGTLLSIGGMVVHSGTWAGSTVGRLEPRLGSIMVLAGAFAATWAMVRASQGWVMALRGISGSPLAPVLELEAPEPPSKAEVRKARPKLVWTRDIVFGLLAAALIGSAAAAPLAHKDMTFYDCRQVQDEWDCIRFDTEATYIAYGVEFRGLNGTTHPYYDDRTRNFDGPLSSGTFTDYHPGTPLLGWAYPIWLGTAGLIGIGGLMQPWRSRWKSVRAVNITFVVLISLALLGAIGILVDQSFQWPGRPAGRLRPAWGLWLIATGYVFLAAMVARSWPKKVKRVQARKTPKSPSEAPEPPENAEQA